MTSLDASNKFADSTLDFVYVDGCHQYESVLQDMSIWWPKIRPGGILAGHDYVTPNENKGGWGQYIQPAVMRCAAEWGVDIELVIEPDNSPWSFILRKPSK